MPRIEPAVSSPPRKSIRQGVLDPKSQSLAYGVLNLFPFASKERLQTWSEAVEREPGLEIEPLLFLAVVCGARFELVRLDPGAICRELSEWLRTHPRRMRGELIAVLIEALRPAIERVADQQGWRHGFDWTPVEVHGRPDETRGAWAAAALVDAHLAHLGMDAPQAAALAQSLASALLDRDTQPNEFYARRAAMAGANTAVLRSAILEAYKELMDTDGRGDQVPKPAASSPELPAWRARHRGLHFMLARDGCEETARRVARGITESFWVEMEATSVPITEDEARS